MSDTTMDKTILVTRAVAVFLTFIGGTLLGQDAVNPEVYVSLATIVVNVVAIASSYFAAKGGADTRMMNGDINDK